MAGIILDLGTGDGKFVYDLARENPDKFIIGIDPYQEGLEKISAKIYKKSARGGLDNAVFVLASAENLPEELNGSVNQVFINFPWGSLLRGVVLADDKIWAGIKRICQQGAIVDIVLGYLENREDKKVSQMKLPILSMDYLNNEFAQKLNEKGFLVEKICELTQEDIKDFPTRWARRLQFNSERKYFWVRVRAL